MATIDTDSLQCLGLNCSHLVVGAMWVMIRKSQGCKRPGDQVHRYSVLGGYPSVS